MALNIQPFHLIQITQTIKNICIGLVWEISQNQQNNMSKHKDKIKGGLADNKQPKDFNQKELKAGTKVEKEHTTDGSIAREIAMDHLSEDKMYYRKLKKMEKK